VSSSGQIANPSRIVLAQTDGINDSILGAGVAKNQTGYLSYAWLKTNAKDSLLRVQSLDLDGNILKERTDLCAALKPSSIAVFGGEANFLLYCQSSDSMLLTPDLTAIPASASSAVIAGPGQYLLVGTANRTFKRIDAGTGQALDAAWTRFWTYGSREVSDRGFFANGNYVILGSDAKAGSPLRDYYGVRVQSSDGALLDPDDDFNQTSGGPLLCQDCGRLVTAAQWLDAGWGIVIVNRDVSTTIPPVTQYEEGIFRISLSPFGRIGSTAGYEQHYTDDKYVGRAYAFADQLLVLNASLLEKASIAQNPFSLTFTSSEIAFPTIAPLSGASVACNGTRFVATAANMTPTFVDQNRTVTPVAGVPTGGLVASNGADFLLVQPSLRRRINADGSLGTAHEGLLAGGGTIFTNPQIASSNRYYMLIKQAGTGTVVEGMRFDLDGNPLDQWHGVDNGEEHSITADTAPAPELRTFGIFAGSPRLTSGTEFRRVRSETGVSIDPLGGVESISRPMAASDGSSFLLVTLVLNQYVQEAQGFLFDPVTGNTVAGFPKKLVDFPYGATPESLWHDGRAYLVGGFTTDYQAADPTARYAVRRYTNSLEPLDLALPEGHALIPDKLFRSVEPPAIASNGQGLSLIAYQYADPDFGGTTLKAVFVYNDGLAATNEDGGSASGGTSGEDGGSASGGVSGADAGSASGGTSGSDGGAGSGGASAADGPGSDQRGVDGKGSADAASGVDGDGADAGGGAGGALGGTGGNGGGGGIAGFGGASSGGGTSAAGGGNSDGGPGSGAGGGAGDTGGLGGTAAGAGGTGTGSTASGGTTGSKDRDAGPTPPDASASRDAGGTDGRAEVAGSRGCSCTLTGRGPSYRGAVLAPFLAALVLRLAKRRRSSRTPRARLARWPN
jgi:hypothetical protein